MPHDANRSLLLDISATVRPHRDDVLTKLWGPRSDVVSCPSAQDIGVDQITGEILLRPCRRNGCLFCARGKCWRIRRAITYTRPTSQIGLSGLPSDPQQIRRLVNRLVEYLRHRDGLDFSMVWAAEPNPSGVGAHVHGWGRGQLPRASLLSARASQAGAGRADVRQVRSYAGLGYPTKLAEWNEDSLAAYRELNGSDMVHGRTFWADPFTGENLTLQEAAVRARQEAR